MQHWIRFGEGFAGRKAAEPLLVSFCSCSAVSGWMSGGDDLDRVLRRLRYLVLYAMVIFFVLKRIVDFAMCIPPVGY